MPLWTIYKINTILSYSCSKFSLQTLENSKQTYPRLDPLTACELGANLPYKDWLL
jgi:hypothetical protein